MHGVADEHCEQAGRVFSGIDADLRDRDHARLRAALGDASFDVAYRRGRALSQADAIALATAAGGATDAQIAVRLFLSVNTVRSHLERIRDKTGARRRTELLRYAIQVGIDPVTPPT